MKIIVMTVANVFVWVICWLMALFACARIGNMSWKVIKSCHGITIGYKQVFWDYLNDKITKQEHDQKLNMYIMQI